MKKFEVGKEYSVRSICNHECVWTYKIVKRTGCTVTIYDGEKAKTCRINKKISEYRGAESIYPNGNYSMCAILSAEQPA